MTQASPADFNAVRLDYPRSDGVFALIRDDCSTETDTEKRPVASSMRGLGEGVVAAQNPIGHPHQTRRTSGESRMAAVIGIVRPERNSFLMCAVRSRRLRFTSINHCNVNFVC